MWSLSISVGESKIKQSNVYICSSFRSRFLYVSFSEYRALFVSGNVERSRSVDSLQKRNAAYRSRNGVLKEQLQWKLVTSVKDTF